MDRNILDCSDLFQICMSKSTRARIWTDPKGKSHVIRFLHPWPGTPYDEIMVLMVYTPSKKQLKTVFDDITRAIEFCEGKDMQIIFIDDHDFKQFNPLVDVIRLCDGDISLQSQRTTYAGGQAYFGFVVGQGYHVDMDEDGFSAVVTKIIANYVPEDPKDKLLTQARKDLAEAAIAMKKAGVKIAYVRL